MHYKRLLLRNHDLDRKVVVNECLELLKQLEEIDPQRRERYKDIGKSGSTF